MKHRGAEQVLPGRQTAEGGRNQAAAGAKPKAAVVPWERGSRAHNVALSIAYRSVGKATWKKGEEEIAHAIAPGLSALTGAGGGSTAQTWLYHPGGLSSPWELLGSVSLGFSPS